jgi:hypothetical protein
MFLQFVLRKNHPANLPAAVSPDELFPEPHPAERSGSGAKSGAKRLSQRTPATTARAKNAAITSFLKALFLSALRSLTH